MFCTHKGCVYLGPDGHTCQVEKVCSLSVSSVNTTHIVWDITPLHGLISHTTWIVPCSSPSGNGVYSHNLTLYAVRIQFCHVLHTLKSYAGLVPPGTTCDCGRYRKVVGQLDVSVGKLRNAVKFVKNGKYWTVYLLSSGFSPMLSGSEPAEYPQNCKEKQVERWNRNCFSKLTKAQYWVNILFI